MPGTPAARDARRTEGGYEARYLRRVLDTARRLQSDTQFLVFTHAANHEAYAGWPRHLVDTGRDSSSRWFKGRSALERAVRAAGPDLLLSPLHSAVEKPDVPQVLYALDAAPWEADAPAPGQATHAGTGAGKRACAGARAIIVPSEYLRHRCLELFEAPLNKIIVAPPGVDATFQRPQSPIVDPPYLLVFSDALSAMRIPELRDAFARRRGEFPYTLVVAGPDTGQEPAEWGAQAVRVERCPDTLLAALYQHCAVFIYPAVRDGAAMRVLEALSAGTIAIVPRSGAIEELAGNVPFYYNARSMDSLVQTTRHVLALSRGEREQRLRFGQSTSAKYTWEKTAWKFLSALKHR